MTIVNGYCTLDDLKHTNALNIDSSDSNSDDFLEAIIEAVSRLIDNKCHRVFYADSDDVVRYFTARTSTDLFVNDIASPSSDVTVEIDTNGDGTYDNTLASTDFILEPYNAELDGEPYQKITISDNGQFLFPAKVKKGVKVTAKWGWQSVPTPIQKGCLLQSERVFKRYSTPLGSESMTALGKMTLSIPSLDPDVEFLISRYIKPTFG